MAWWPVLAPAPLPGWLLAMEEGEGGWACPEAEGGAALAHGHEFTVEFTPGRSLT